MSEARKDIAQWLAIRKEQAKKIDPKTAKVTWVSGQILDPYGVHELRPEEECIGRLYFARAPDSDVWVSFDDLAEQPGMLFGRTLNFAWKRMTSFSHSESERGRVR